jgi:dihydropteroate synthase
VILDPGLGFGKDVIEGNYKVLNQLPQLKEAFPNKPLLVGLSRKRMIWQLLGCTPESNETLQGTMMANIIALERGADILRVHDVKEAAMAIAMHKAMQR